MVDPFKAVAEGELRSNSRVYLAALTEVFLILQLQGQAEFTLCETE
jgi:hypothetical protein